MQVQNKSQVGKISCIHIYDATMLIKLQTDRNVKYSYVFQFKNEHEAWNSSTNMPTTKWKINTITMLHEYQIAYYIQNNQFTQLSKSLTRSPVIAVQISKYG